ncbi:MAG: hypothetical protein EB162_05855 [Euryarchaeota archaeon]|nr:hypothetical protein [Euryarchaeota archaeon]
MLFRYSEMLLLWTHNLDGTLVGFQDPVADHWVDGKYGKALKFNGTSSYVLIPGTPLLDLEQFSIAAWVKSTDFDRNMFVFEKTTNNIINTQYNLFFEDSGTINFRMNDGGSDFVSDRLHESARSHPSMSDQRRRHER